MFRYRACIAFTGLLVTAVALGGCGDDSDSVNPDDVRPDRAAEAEAGEKYMRDFASCVTENGIPMTWDANMEAYRVDHGGDVAGMRRVQDDCHAQLGGPLLATPLSTEELEKFYDLQVEAHECLLALGYDVVPPSSKEAFIATFESGDSWYAHESANPGVFIPDDECPQPDYTDITW